MITILSALVSLLSFRVRRRASPEIELVALRHQVTVLRRQRPGQLRLFSTDRLLWVWLYRVATPVTGKFGDETRRAITNWQSARGYPVSKGSRRG
jgi:peptidoglycan hydrolase-like protein with peptidoglycan-binding domain